MSNDQLFKTPKDHERGMSLLLDPKTTQDTALTAEQRREYGPEGLLPHVAESSPENSSMANARNLPRESTSVGSNNAEPRRASMHPRNSSAKPAERSIAASSPQISQTLRAEERTATALPNDLGDLEETDIRSLLLSATQNIVDRIYGLFPLSDETSERS
jgi:hypothetical protein